MKEDSLRLSLSLQRALLNMVEDEIKYRSETGNVSQNNIRHVPIGSPGSLSREFSVDLISGFQRHIKTIISDELIELKYSIALNALQLLNERIKRQGDSRK